jgi:hypothetical protein
MSLEVFIHDLAKSCSNNLVPVPVLCLDKKVYSSLFSLHINNVYDLSRLSYEFKVGHFKSSTSINAFKYKHNFDIVTYSNTEKNKEIDTIFLDFMYLFVKPNGYIIVDRVLNKKSFKTFNNWNVYKMGKMIECQSSSQIIYKHIYNKCNLTSSNFTYYATSEEREEEVREAYKGDSEFIITNITSAIHACILNSLFPNLKFIIRIKKEDLLLNVMSQVGELFFIK